MLQVAALLSDVANVAFKREASRSLQDTADVDGENRKSSRVKKQKPCPSYPTNTTAVAWLSSAAERTMLTGGMSAGRIASTSLSVSSMVSAASGDH